jgi:flagellar protein FlbD
VIAGRSVEEGPPLRPASRALEWALETMITLHRIAHPDEPFQLNDDLIVTVEATPDTVITLANNHKIVVSESPDEVTKAIRTWRASILSVVPRSA